MELLQPSWFLGLIMWPLMLNYVCVFYAGYRLVFGADKFRIQNKALCLIILGFIPFSVFVYLYIVMSSIKRVVM